MKKVALVTGGTSGLGLQLINDLTNQGYKVYSISRNKKTINKLKIIHPETVFICGDITNEQDINTAFKLIASKEQRLDALINNAGIIYSGGIEQLSFRNWKKVFDINVNGLFLCTQRFLPLLKTTKNSSIINISSISSQIISNSISYSASKAAIDMITKSLAKELSQHGIRVNSVNPGIMNTGFQVHNKLMPKNEYLNFLNNIEQTYPFGIGTAKDVTNLILFLISNEAKWITGSNYIIDGGHSVNNWCTY